MSEFTGSTSTREGWKELDELDFDNIFTEEWLEVSPEKKRSDEPANKKLKHKESRVDENHRSSSTEPIPFPHTAHQLSNRDMPPAITSAGHPPPDSSSSVPLPGNGVGIPPVTSGPPDSGHHQPDTISSPSTLDLDLPIHYVVTSAKNGQESKKRAKATLARSFWDRIVKRRQDVRGRSETNTEELQDLIFQLHQELAGYYGENHSLSVRMPVFVQEIKKSMARGDKNAVVENYNGHSYLLLSTEDGTLTEKGRSLLFGFVKENHHFPAFVRPLDDSFVKEAEAKANHLTRTNTGIHLEVMLFKGMVNNCHEALRVVQDSDHKLDVACVRSINEFWKKLVGKLAKEPPQEPEGPRPRDPPEGPRPPDSGSGRRSGRRGPKDHDPPNSPNDSSDSGETKPDWTHKAAGSDRPESSLGTSSSDDCDMCSYSSSGIVDNSSDSSSSTEELDQIEKKANLIITRLLHNNMSDIEAKDAKGWTALHHMSFLGHLYFVGFLLHRGANPQARTNQGKTPLDLAQDGEVIELLVHESHLLQQCEKTLPTTTSHNCRSEVETISTMEQNVSKMAIFVSQDSTVVPRSELPPCSMLIEMHDPNVADRLGESTPDRKRNTHRQRATFQPSAGARLSFSEMLKAPPVKPTQETFTPEIHLASTNPLHVHVVPPIGCPASSVPPVYVMRRTGAMRAYALVQDKPSTKITHQVSNWGEIFFGIMYKRSSESPYVFQAPSQEQVQYVLIKKLDKRMLFRYLDQGGVENPFKAIDRMQKYGDNVHVIRCLDALEDDEHLYIVTPMGICSLNDVIQWGSDDTMEPARVKSIFRKILTILAYLEQHGICCHDLSPDNLVFLSEDNLVLSDLSLSVRLPTNEQGRRCLMTPQGNSGNCAYMAPEIYMDRIFCGVHSDLWSAAVILYNLLTNRQLYRIPHPANILFRYNVMAKGLSESPLNERAVEVVLDATKEEREELLLRLKLSACLSPEARELLENLLALSVANRWTLAEAMESAFVQGDD